MTFEEASIIIGNIPIPLVILGTHDQCYSLTEYQDAKAMAIKSLKAWELVKKEVIAKKNFNAEVKDAFEVGSHSRTECNTTVAVLGEVLNLIDSIYI